MAYFPFQNDIDKVTERELVYDIVERLSLGEDLGEIDNTLWTRGTLITTILKKLAYALPASITLNMLNVKTGVITINAGQSSGSTVITNLNNNILLMAVSEQTGCDIKDCIQTNVSGNNVTYSITVNTPYTKNEYIKIYAY